MLEPIFEADFEPCSYGFRPMLRAQDAIAEIHFYGTRGYEWVLDADRAVAADHGGRDRDAADRGDTGHPVPLPRHQDPQSLDPDSSSLTAGTVESPLR